MARARKPPDGDVAAAPLAGRWQEKQAIKQVHPERLHFRAFLASNPNYFGNVSDLIEDAADAVVQIQGNTTYEELVCVGLQPQLDLLEGVVLVHQSFGFNGNLCSGGSTEYVRFYLSYDGGATWHDQGMTSFTAHDLPGPKPLEYAVSLSIKPAKRWCIQENLPLVRAILSWNWAPPANTPNFNPVWGNVVEADVQGSPSHFILKGDLIELAKAGIAKQLEPLLAEQASMPISEPEPVGLQELHKLYAKKDVPGHRYVFPHLEKLQALPQAQLVSPPSPGPGPLELHWPVAGGEEGPAADMPIPNGDGGPFPPVPFPGPVPPPFPGPILEPDMSIFSKLPIDIGSIIGKILETDGDTSFEELTCVGLNPTQDTLEGVLTVKKSAGYSGSLCTAGSREYVAFWVDWGDGAGWTFAGTTSVRVHDLTGVPAGGLHYGVVLPLNLSGRQKPCAKGVVTARVRAILSWEFVPPSNDPDFVPTWGNREETIVQIKPGETVPPGDLKLYLESVSSVPVCSVDQSTGFAPGDKPFGGQVVLTGFIPGAPDVNSPAANKVKYKVFATPVDSSGNPLPGESPQQLTNSFGISVIDQTSPGGLPLQHGMTQQLDPSGFYTFQEDMNSADGTWRLVQNRVLASWLTAAPMTGLWRLTVEAELLGSSVPVGTLACPDGTTRTSVIVRLDEGVPTASLAITGVSQGTGPVNPAQECETFKKGQTIHGTYSSFDEHFGSLSLTVEPTGPATAFGPTAVNPSSRSYPVVPTGGESGTWELDTSNMKACGYIVRLWVQDRTIVSGDGSGWKNAASVGFCLKT